MKLKQICNVWAICAMFTAAAAVASPDEKAKTAKGKTPCSAMSAKTVSDKAPCSAAKAKTVADDGRSETSKPCCAKKAKNAKTASAKKGGCGAGCSCDKGAKLTAGKDKAPCHKSAELTAGKGKSPCHKGAQLTKDGGCPIQKKVDAILTSMPTMKYRVGDKTMGCSKSAAAMAEKANTSVEYVVGDETMGSETEATVTLTKLLEEQLGNMQTMQYVVGDHCGQCPMTAKSLAKKSGTKMAYRVGGFDFEKKEDAQKVVKLVSEAIAEVQMSYKVDGKSFNCSKSAGAKCKKTGAKMTYVIGDDETCCKITATLKHAEAKIRKVVETAAAAAMSL